MHGRPILAVAAALALGVAGWSCSPGPGGAPKPAPKAEPAPTATANADGLVPLKLNPHRPSYFNTPRILPNDPRLEPLDVKRPPVLVPEGCTNLALKKPVTSSSEFFIMGDLAMITDGETDGNNDYYVELDTGSQWVQIDLGAPSLIYAIAVYHYHAIHQNCVYHDVVIQVSDDPGFVKGVQTVFNNDYDNSSGLGVGKDLEYVEDYRGRVFQVPGVRGRYVRLWSNGSVFGEANDYVQVQVYGKPAR